MMQEPLFFEDWREAMRHVVAALGGAKAVGARMRPDMKPDHAGRWVSDCLNADRREHFSPDHLFLLMRLAREAGIHTGMAFIAEDCGYRAPTPVDPADMADELRREFTQSVKRLDAIAERIEKFEQRHAAVRAVARGE